MIIGEIRYRWKKKVMKMYKTEQSTGGQTHNWIGNNEWGACVMRWPTSMSTVYFKTITDLYWFCTINKHHKYRKTIQYLLLCTRSNFSTAYFGRSDIIYHSTRTSSDSLLWIFSFSELKFPWKASTSHQNVALLHYRTSLPASASQSLFKLPPWINAFLSLTQSTFTFKLLHS